MSEPAFDTQAAVRRLRDEAGFDQRAAEVLVEVLVDIVQTTINKNLAAFEARQERMLDARFAEVDRRFEQVDRRFDQVDRRFEQVDRRFEQVDQRFEQVDQRFEQVDQRFELLQQEMDRRFTQLQHDMQQQFEWLQQNIAAQLMESRAVQAESQRSFAIQIMAATVTSVIGAGALFAIVLKLVEMVS